MSKVEEKYQSHKSRVKRSVRFLLCWGSDLSDSLISGIKSFLVQFLSNKIKTVSWVLMKTFSTWHLYERLHLADSQDFFMAYFRLPWSLITHTCCKDIDWLEIDLRWTEGQDLHSTRGSTRCNLDCSRRWTGRALQIQSLRQTDRKLALAGIKQSMARSLTYNQVDSRWRCALFAWQTVKQPAETLLHSRQGSARTSPLCSPYRWCPPRSAHSIE